MIEKPKEKIRMIFEYEPETGHYAIEFASNNGGDILYPFLKYFLRKALDQYENSEVEISTPNKVVKFLQ